MGIHALIEGGGSWFRLATDRGRGDLEIEAEIETRDPESTLNRVVEHFTKSGAKFDAVGLACFGPLDVDPASRSRGRLLATTKTEWSGVDIAGTLRERLGAPVHFHTDVVGAAYGEWVKGAAKDARSVLYLTVGTGIGGGLLVDGIPVGGAQHGELGHVSLRRERGDRFPGVCPFHGDCLEGLASGPAIAKRALRKAENLPLEHAALTKAMNYLAQAVSNFVLTAAPDVIVIGGGVMRDGAMLPVVRARVFESLRGYLPAWSNEETVERRILAPGLGRLSALYGAREMIQRGAGIVR
jgi:fructokinase